MAMHFAAVAMGPLTTEEKTFGRRVCALFVNDFSSSLRTPMERNTINAKPTTLYAPKRGYQFLREPGRKEIPAKSKNNGHELVLIFL